MPIKYLQILRSTCIVITNTKLVYMQLHYISCIIVVCISTLKCEKSEAKNCISCHGSGIRLNSITSANLCGHLVCVLLICGLNTTSEIKPSNIVLYRHVLSCRIQPPKKTNFLHKHVHTHTHTQNRAKLYSYAVNQFRHLCNTRVL